MAEREGSDVESVISKEEMNMLSEVAQITKERGIFPTAIGAAVTLMAYSAYGIFVSGAGVADKTASVVVAGLILLAGMVLKALQYKWELNALVRQDEQRTKRLEARFRVATKIAEDAEEPVKTVSPQRPD